MLPLNSPIEAYKGILIFEVSDREYCMDYSCVTSTLRQPFKIIKDYKEDKQIFSVLSLRGKLIPLIDLNQELKKKGAGRNEKRESRVILIEINNELFGILVDKIKEVVALDTKFIATSLKFNPETELPDNSVGKGFIEGSLEFEGRNLQLLDMMGLADAAKIPGQEKGSKLSGE